MNDAEDTAYYLHKGFRVVAIEANPVLADRARARFANEVTKGTLRVVNAAIANTEALLPFWICDSHTEWSSFNREVASRNGARHHMLMVEGRRFASIIEEYGVPYFLKIDIEGSDINCITDLHAGNVPPYTSIEFGNAVRRNLPLFRSLGYSAFKCISQLHYLPLQQPPSSQEAMFGPTWSRLYSNAIRWRLLRKLGWRHILESKIYRLRTYGDWTFSLGSSGPFGEDTHGNWLSYEEFEDTLDAAESRFKQGIPSIFWGNERYSFWADIHMKL